MENKIEKRYKQIREEIAKLGGKLNVVNKKERDREINFFIKIKKHI
jgi:hypothetical protein